jgi:ribosomal protein S18 acetylase RimI-like enzyme
MLDGVAVTVRPVDWPVDASTVAAIDASFETDRIYRVERDELGFRLVETPVDPPLRKPLVSLADELADLRRLPFAAVAELDGAVVGLVAAHHEAWHNRVRVEHLYLSPPGRGRGAGRALVDAVAAYASQVGAACLWLETQNTNYGAIRFYRRVGFRLCGLDERFYDRRFPAGDEVALFFALDL